LKIRIYYEDVIYRLRGSKRALKLIEKVIGKEKKISGDLNFIITSDQHLIKVNTEFLKNNYFTDVIAFNYNVKGMVNNLYKY
jgi:ssRNA-specific RNase YbeY (16S rRNA maturation enzyme)